MSTPPPPSLNALLDETEWVRSLALRLVGRADEADDLTQETLAAALTSPPAHGGSVRGWLAMVLRNRVRARHRGKVLGREADEVAARQGEVDSVPSPAELIERAEAHQSVVEAVMALSEPFRTTVLMRYFDGRTPTEIAQQQGIPLATVTSRLTRAHARLRDALGEDALGEGDRRGWLAALAPLLVRSPLPAAANKASVGGLTQALPTSTSSFGVSFGSIVLMSTAFKVTVASVIALLIAVASTSWFDRSELEALDASQADVALESVDAVPLVAQLNDAEVAAPGRAEIGLAEEVTPPAESAAPETSATQGLSGTVVGADGTPAEGATVVIGGSGALQFLDMDKEAPKSAELAITDEAGRFTFEETPGVRVLLTAGRVGEAPSHSLVWEPGDPAEVSLMLRRGIRIYGSVHRADGSLARGRKVRLLQERGSRDPFGGVLARYIETDELGQFDERGLCPGEWGVVTYPDDEELKEIGGAMVDHMIQTTVELEDGQEVHVPLGLRSRDAVRVRGRVTFGGEPARGIMQWIQECPDPMGSQRNATLAKDGTYEIELGSPGVWYVRVKGSGKGVGSGEFYPRIPAVEALEQDFALPMGGIRGVVRDAAGEPVKNAQVSLQLVEGDYERGPLRGSDDMAYSTSKGEFLLRGVEPGEYVVGAIHDTLGVATSQRLTVVQDEITEDVEFVVRGGLTISGTFQGSTGFSGLSSPLWIFDEEGRLVNPVSRLATSKGAFTTPPLPEGRYSLFIQSGLEVAWAGDIQLGGANVVDVEMQLSPGATVTVTTLAEGEPVRALVRVVDEGGRCLTGQRYFRDPWQWRRHPFSSTEKRVGPFPPGTYTVTSWVPGVGQGESKITLVGAEELAVEIKL
ncbi:MAG: sigma-70 family RNA polymerase sigma factor [Planctomycetota bacterium]